MYLTEFLLKGTKNWQRLKVGGCMLCPRNSKEALQDVGEK